MALVTCRSSVRMDTSNTEKTEELWNSHFVRSDGIPCPGHERGESSTMKRRGDEPGSRAVIEAAAGRIPFIVGAGSTTRANTADKPKYEKWVRWTAADFPYYKQGEHRRSCPSFSRLWADEVSYPHHSLQHPRTPGMSYPVTLWPDSAPHP